MYVMKLLSLLVSIPKLKFESKTDILKTLTETKTLVKLLQLNCN